MAWRMAVLTTLLGLLAGPGQAKETLDPVEGRWTTSGPDSCAARAYTWTITGDEMQFRDPAGRLDTERVVARRDNGFVTTTTASATTPRGTQWDYRFETPDRVQVRNLSNGRGFTLTRCPASAQADDDAPRGGWQFTPAQGGGSTLTFGDRGSYHPTIYLACSVELRRAELTVGAGDMPIGRPVRVTFTAGGESVSLAMAAAEGPTGNVLGVVPPGHPLLLLLQSQGALRIRSAGGEVNLTIPLAGVAPLARRFAATCPFS